MRTGIPSHVTRFTLLLVCAFSVALCGHFTSLPAGAETSAAEQNGDDLSQAPNNNLQSAMVVVDGKELFRLAGIRSFPAKKRARNTEKYIVELAKNPAFDPKSITVVEDDGVHTVYANKRAIVHINPADVYMEGDFSPEKYAKVLVREGIVRAIENYRYERLPETLKQNAFKALYRTATLSVILVLLFWGFKKADQAFERRFRRKIETLESKSKRILQAQHIWNLTKIFIRLFKIVVVVLVVYIFFHFVLGLFPWTRYFALTSLGYVINPLRILTNSFIDYLPSLFFLIITFLIFRYLLRVTRAFFNQVSYGQFKITGFEADWAMPTYRIVRILIIILAIVIAYPYIPGSGSEAFKGISILVGVLFSLGSSSLIANIIAGYTMTYRRAFKEGDRVKFGEYVGEVTEVRLLETHLKSLKNEEIVIPNSKILSGEVTNYSSMAKKHGLILHTTVGIGYEVPWRQVEAMLMMAGERTKGLQRKSKPFVLQKALGDFGVTYELNVFCRQAENMMQIYSDLHRNVQDVFNEYGVAIMTPHYVGDTEDPKTVPKEKWFVSPAQEPRE